VLQNLRVKYVGITQSMPTPVETPALSLSFNLMFPTFGAALSKPLWGDE